MNFQVPYVYWVSYLTLQGNLINIPFAFTFFWSFFNPGFFFKVAASFVAWLFPNWRDLELAVGLVLIRITFVIGEVIIVGID